MRWYSHAVVDLTNVVARLTGARLAVCDEHDVPAHAKAVIYLGETEAAATVGIDGEGMRNADWRVKVVPGKAFLYGKTGMAASYAMTEFVEGFLGYRFLSPDGIDPFVRSPGLMVRVGDVVRRPVIYDREIYTGMRIASKYPQTASAWETWQRRRRSIVTDEIEPKYRVTHQTPNCHAIYSYIPPEKYFSEHPEYYSMDERGKRCAVRNARSQICYTNPDVRRIVYGNLVDFIEKDRKKYGREKSPLIYDLTQMDVSDSLCLCPDCRRVIAKYNRIPGGNKEGGDAGLQLEFANDLARRIAKQYPDVFLRVFAYVSTERAPKPQTIRPEPNVIVWWCDVYSYSDHTLPLDNRGHFNARQSEELLEWGRCADRFQVWDYMLYTSEFPEVSPDAIAADAVFFSRLGFETLFMESEYREQPFYPLNFYLMSELYVDPMRDVEGLVRAACGIYGRGAPEMEEAVRFLRDVERVGCSSDKDEWHLRLMPWLNRANMERLVGLFEAAYAKESDPVIRARIALALRSASRKLMMILKTEPDSSSAFAAAVEKYRFAAKEWARFGFVEPSDRNDKIAAVDDEIGALSLRFEDLPEELSDVSPHELVCVDYHVIPSHKRRQDAMSARGFTIAQTSPTTDYKGGYPIACGAYDCQSKDGWAFSIGKDVMPADGKYHWVRCGEIHLGRNTIFWFPWSWVANVPFKDYFMTSDGAATDPNWYDLWVSMRVSGPVFSAESKEENVIRVDRAVLRRIKKTR